MVRKNKLKKFYIYENNITKNKYQNKSHPSIMMSDKKDYIENFIITHKKPKNNFYKLKTNPNNKDTRDSYIQKRLYKTTKNKIGHKYRFILGNDDKNLIEIIYRKIKNK